MEIKGIEVSGEIYDIEDETARTNAESASESVTALSTTVETLNSQMNDPQGKIASLQIQADNTEEDVGDLDNLETTEKSSLVGAINEVNGNIPNLKLLDITSYFSTPTSSLGTFSNFKVLVNSLKQIAVSFTFTPNSSFSVSQSEVLQYKFSSNVGGTVANLFTYLRSQGIEFATSQPILAINLSALAFEMSCEAEILFPIAISLAPSTNHLQIQVNCRVGQVRTEGSFGGMASVNIANVFQCL